MVILTSEVETEYYELVSEHYGVNVEVGNIADAVAVYPNYNY